METLKFSIVCDEGTCQLQVPRSVAPDILADVLDLRELYDDIADGDDYREVIASRVSTFLATFTKLPASARDVEQNRYTSVDIAKCSYWLLFSSLPPEKFEAVTCIVIGLVPGGQTQIGYDDEDEYVATLRRIAAGESLASIIDTER